MKAFSGQHLFIHVHSDSLYSRYCFWLSGQGLDQLWRYALICLVTATVLHGVTTWLKQHVMDHPSK
ncbi:hypothetical protein OE903_15020 [Bacillus sp. B6(2022)]|nr:hypothetical protein [Bacillus sp. B6(2022)]